MPTIPNTNHSYYLVLTHADGTVEMCLSRQHPVYLVASHNKQAAADPDRQPLILTFFAEIPGWELARLEKEGLMEVWA